MARIVDNYNQATGEDLPSDTVFGLRLVYEATFTDGHTEIVSVVVNAVGVWDIYQLEQVIAGDVENNVFQQRWGQRYKISGATLSGIGGINVGGYSSPAISL